MKMALNVQSREKPEFLYTKITHTKQGLFP